MSICDVIRFCYDTDAIALRMFGSIGWIALESHEYVKIPLRFYKYVLGNSARKLGMNYETIKNTLKACMNPVRIKAILWLILTIREIFSPKFGIKAIYPCLGITS